MIGLKAASTLALRHWAAAKLLDCAGRAKRRRRFRTWRCLSDLSARLSRTKKAVSRRTCHRTPKKLRGLRRFLTILIPVALLFLAQSEGAAAAEAFCASNHILIRFKPEARALLPAAPLSAQLTALLHRLDLPPGAELHETSFARSVRRKRKADSPSAPDQVDLDRFFYLRLPQGMDAAECVRRLQNHPWLEYAEPDWIGRAAETIPDDPDFAQQWHHANPLKPSASIQTPLAWDITRGSTNVLVAVLDTGLADLPEFAGRTVPGYNFAYTNSDTMDDNGHGTQVAGVLAASANNATLGAGVDWHCRIMPIKVFDSANQGFYSWWAQGIDYAVSNGCKIINLSGAGTEFGRTVQRAITNAIAQGVIFVTAAGNMGQTNLSFPGYLTACITVGATDQEDRRAPFSNSGPQLDLAAPGADIITVGRFGDLESARGTSFSAPMVAGVCALLAAVRPGLTQADARLLLCAGADDEVGDATDAPGFDNYYGWGRLNAFNSLVLAATRVDQARHASGGIELSWISPASAGHKQPYRVECKASLASDWIPLTDTNAFRYATNRAYWTDDGTQTGGVADARYYRVGLRGY
jgi:subtilisin family serine protease